MHIMSTSSLGWIAAGIVILLEIIFVFDIAFNKNSKLRPLIKDNSSQEDINTVFHEHNCFGGQS